MTDEQKEAAFKRKRMSQGIVCKCEEAKVPLRDRAWEIVHYRCNHSAFNGYHETPSDYSQLRCRHCQATWRTKSKYVKKLRTRDR